MIILFSRLILLVSKIKTKTMNHFLKQLEMLYNNGLKTFKAKCQFFKIFMNQEKQEKVKVFHPFHKPNLLGVIWVKNLKENVVFIPKTKTLTIWCLDFSQPIVKVHWINHSIQLWHLGSSNSNKES